MILFDKETENMSNFESAFSPIVSIYEDALLFTLLLVSKSGSIWELW